MIQLDLAMSSAEAEGIIQQELLNVEFIGELALDRDNFKTLNGIVRGAAPTSLREIRGEWRVQLVPKALFAVSMVFCTRYSEDDHRVFWSSYAKIVWNIDQADQVFQSQCRDYFKVVRSWLKKTYGFYFPLRSDNVNSVVRDVYTHAIIPFYLQDDFARWLKDLDWDTILHYSPDELVAMLRYDERRLPSVRTLRQFITDDVTAPIAADLVKTIVEAANLYRTGTEHREILQILDQKPIQKELWNPLVDVLAKNITPQARTRTDKSILRVDWGWSLDDDQMRIVVSAFDLISEQKPERWVWVKPGEDLASAQIFKWVTPWDGGDQHWHVDELIIADGPIPGRLYLLAEDGSILKEAEVPTLPVEPIQVFRITHQNTIGIPVNPFRTLSNGEWLISKTADTQILDAEGNVVLPRHPDHIPEPLDEYGHVEAGQYALTLPLRFIYHDHERSVEKMGTSLIEVELEGVQVPDLAPQIPPVFTDRQVTVVLRNFESRYRHGLMLWLVKANMPTRRFTFPDLEADHRVEIREQEIRIDLAGLLDNGNFQLEVRRNLQLATADPLKFAVLDGFSMTVPDTTKLYSPLHLPQAFIPGISAGQVVTTGQVENTDEGIRLTWDDLKDNCRLTLDMYGEPILLMWEVQRFYAWTEPDIQRGFLTQHEIENAVIHIRGPRNLPFSIQVNEGDPRRMELKKGRHDMRIRDDQLWYMLKEQQDTRVSIYLSSQEQRWKLFDLVRQPEIRSVLLDYDTSTGVLSLQCDTDAAWYGNFTLRAKAHYTDQTILLAELDSLSSEQLTLPCSLDYGAYLLEILAEGKSLPFSELPILVVDNGQLAGLNIASDTLRTALHWLDRDDLVPIAPEAVPALVYLLRSRDALQIREWYQLAMTPAQRLNVFSLDDLVALWKPLGALALAQDQAAWEQVYGTVPEWVQFRNYSHFVMQNPRQRIRIFAETLPEEIASGNGFAEIYFGNGLPKVRVLVRWKQQFEEKFSLTLALPSAETAEHFLITENADDPHFYCCSTCDLILAINGVEAAAMAAVQAHYHQKHRSRTSDLTKYKAYKAIEVTANLLPETLTHAVVSDHPEQIINRKIIASYLQTDRPPMSAHHPITTAAGYKNAVANWVARYQQTPAFLNQLMVAVSQRHKSFDALKQQVQHHHHGIPLFLAAKQLLNVLEPPPQQAILFSLDQAVFLLALCLRMPNYGYAQSHLADQELAQLLALAEQACPRLLEWAFTWIEIICVQNTAALSGEPHESH